MIQLSIIIPVYNAENFISACIESIVYQEGVNFEIILVDDGSTDNSGRICDEYAAKDYRIKVIHKGNGGVSSARNTGIENSSGEWLLFVDADDVLMPNALNAFFSFKNEIVEFVVVGYQRSDERNMDISYPTNKKEYLGPKEFSRYLFAPRDGRYQGYIWNKLFRRDLIDRYCLLFATDIFYNEDRLFIFEYLSHLNGLCYINNELGYIYNVHSLSAMQSLPGRYKLFRTDLDAFIRMYHNVYTQSDPQLVTLIRYCTYISYRDNILLTKKYDSDPKTTISELRFKVKEVLSIWHIFYFYWKNKVVQCISKLKRIHNKLRSKLYLLFHSEGLR